MSINVNTVYTSVQAVIAKELGSGYCPPATFDIYSNMATNELFNKYADIYQERQQITDKILPFIKKEIIDIDFTTGRMLYPSDYVDAVAIRAFDPVELAAALCSDDPPNYNAIRQIKVKVIDNDELGDRLTSLVVNPTQARPIAVFYDSYLQFYPVSVGSAILEYLRQPIDVVWGFTLDIYGLEVYDPTTSVNFEFDWKMTNELIVKICEYFGVSVREQDLVQYSIGMQQQQA